MQSQPKYPTKVPVHYHMLTLTTATFMDIQLRDGSLSPLPSSSNKSQPWPRHAPSLPVRETTNRDSHLAACSGLGTSAEHFWATKCLF